MSISDMHGPDGPSAQVTAVSGAPSTAEYPAADARGTAFIVADSPESRYLTGAGKPLVRHIIELKNQRMRASARVEGFGAVVRRAESTASERHGRHRGGDRPWPLRVVILVGILAESLTAYVAMETLVASQALALALAMLTAMVGTGLACAYANRRLSGLQVPGTARILEVVFVAVLTALRYDSLRVQGAGLLAAVGAAGLAALVGALGLLGIEEVVMETYTFSVFASTARASWSRWRNASAVARLRRSQARVEATSEQLRQHFLSFLLAAERLPLGEAQRRAMALKRTLVDGEDAT